MSESEGVRRFDADFKKTPGTLSLTATHIAWVPTSPNAMDRQNQAMNRAISLCTSERSARGANRTQRCSLARRALSA